MLRLIRLRGRLRVSQQISLHLLVDKVVVHVGRGSIRLMLVMVLVCMLMLLVLVHQLLMLLRFLRLVLRLMWHLTEASHQIEVVRILLILLDCVLPVLPLEMRDKLVL